MNVILNADTVTLNLVVDTLIIGQTILFTVDPAGSELNARISPTSYNGYDLTWSTSNLGDTYTATYTVVDDAFQSDYLSSSLQLGSVTVTDAAGNTGAGTNYTVITQRIDANAPAAPATATPTGPKVPAGPFNVFETAAATPC